MFGIFASPARKMRQNAANWLELAEKVYHYRRDLLPAAELAELQAQSAGLQRLLKERADPMKLKLGIEALEETLRRTGGTHYPKSSITENVEFFLVAAIVILGFRTYFLQPFKIPTNSMWPSYYGMTPEAFVHQEDEPGKIMQVVRLLAFGAKPVRAVANADGEVMIPLVGDKERAYLPYTKVPGRNWLIFPAIKKEYKLVVGNSTTTVLVPEEFDFEWAIRDAYFPDAIRDHEPASVSLARILAAQKSDLRSKDGRLHFLPSGRIVAKNDRILAFDVMTGDQLFVDRMSYHFMRPEVGQGFVFRTGQIHSEYMVDRNGNQLEQYYIKRLVGVPGDTLEIKDYTLYRNGAPITGAAAFTKNATRSDHYVGYRNELGLAVGETMTVPPDSYLALGDNSANSQDGRYWGYVPAKEAVGRPLFIYYPFTKRWGPAR